MITMAWIGLTTSSGLTHKRLSKMSLTLKTNINLGGQREKGNHETDPQSNLVTFKQEHCIQDNCQNLYSIHRNLPESWPLLRSNGPSAEKVAATDSTGLNYWENHRIESKNKQDLQLTLTWSQPLRDTTLIFTLTDVKEGEMSRSSTSTRYTTSRIRRSGALGAT